MVLVNVNNHKVRNGKIWAKKLKKKTFHDCSCYKIQTTSSRYDFAIKSGKWYYYMWYITHSMDGLCPNLTNMVNVSVVPTKSLMFVALNCMRKWPN